MQKYLGVKIVQAEPMSQKEFIDSIERPMAFVQGLTEGYKVVYPDGYISWSPKDVFEKAYKCFDEKHFGIIIDVDTRDGNWRFVTENFVVPNVEIQNENIQPDAEYPIRILDSPSHHSLIDCLQELMFGRTDSDQHFLQSCINSLNYTDEVCCPSEPTTQKLP